MMWVTSLFAVVATVCAHSAQEWKQSRIIYQLLTDRFALPGGVTDASCSDLRNYCGGTFQGIIDRLDYIQELGFNAIWISPVVKNSPGHYHGYAAIDFYTISPEFGGEAGLKALVEACHQKGIWVMVDVVANHMSDRFPISQLIPFNETYHYHDCKGCPEDCNINEFDGGYVNEHCRLSNLVDLDQDHPWVRSKLLEWISNLVKRYNVDGLRIDTIPMVKPQFWAEFQTAAGVYAVGEVFSGDVNLVSRYQKGGLNALLNYPLYQEVISVFADQTSMWALHNLFSTYKVFSDSSILGTFFDNHDNPRFLSKRYDVNSLKNALTFSLLAEGIPIMYYGTEQLFHGGDDPGCREPLWYSKYDNSTDMFKFVQTLVGFWKSHSIGTHPMSEKWVKDHIYVYSRGSNVIVATTNSFSVTETVQYLDLPEGRVLCNLFNPHDCVTVHQSSLTVSIQDGLPKVYYYDNQNLSLKE
jgi:alpha-amylase